MPVSIGKSCCHVVQNTTQSHSIFIHSLQLTVCLSISFLYFCLFPFLSLYWILCQSFFFLVYFLLSFSIFIFPSPIFVLSFLMRMSFSSCVLIHNKPCVIALRIPERLGVSHMVKGRRRRGHVSIRVCCTVCCVSMLHEEITSSQESFSKNNALHFNHF